MTKVEIDKKSIDLIHEKKSLKTIISHYNTVGETNTRHSMMDLCFRTFKPYIKGGLALELGCEDGNMSEQIAKSVDSLDVVDATEEFLEQVKARGMKNVNCYCSLFEEFSPNKQYDYVFANHILEHVISPSSTLEVAKQALKPGGLLFATVPNAHAASRQLARHMGVLDGLYDLTPNDISYGHRRVYDRVTFNKDITSSGFEIISQGGILFRLFTNFHMEKIIDSGILGSEQIEGLYRLGLEYPDMCSSIFVIARRI